MLKDDRYFDKLRSGEAPQLPSSLANFVGQTLCNHYEDTVRSPLPDDMRRHLDALREIGPSPIDDRGAPDGN